MRINLDSAFSIIFRTMILRLSLSLFALAAMTQLAFAGTSEEWTADFASETGRLQFLESVLSAHPELIQTASKYHVDPMDMMTNANRLLKQLGAQMNGPLKVEPSLRLSYTGNLDAPEFTYNESDLAIIRQELTHAVKAASPLLINLHSKISQSLKDNKSHSLQTRSAFLLLTPLLYGYNLRLNEDIESLLESARKSQSSHTDAGLESVTKNLNEQIRKLSGDKLDNLYNDLFKEHLLPEISRDHAWTDSLNRMRQRFIKGTLASKLIRHHVSAEITNSKQYAITLERVPKSVALFRGLIGHDCSMMSVPFYSLLPTVHTFWIRKSTGFTSEPIGYLLMTEVEHRGHTVPYIITVNGGTLSMGEARLAILMVAHLYQTPTILTAKTDHVVNTKSMKDALWQEDARATGTKIRLPSMWTTVDNFQATGTFLYQRDGYYLEKKLSNANQVSLNKKELLIATKVSLRISKQVYQSSGNQTIEELGITDRAFIAAFSPKLATRLSISKEQLSAIKSFSKILKEVNADDLDDPPEALPDRLRSLNSRIVPIVSKALSALQIDLNTLGKYMSVRFKTKLLGAATQARSSKTKTLFSDQLTTTWNHLATNQLKTNLENYRDILSVAGIYETLFDLAQLPKTEGVQHFFIDGIYQNYLTSKDLAPSFKLMIWEHLKHPTTNDRELLFEELNTMAKTEPHSFLSEIRKSLPTRLSPEIFHLFDQVLESNNKAASQEALTYLVYHDSPSAIEKAFSFYLTHASDSEVSTNFIEALLIQHRWPQVIFDHAPQLITKIGSKESNEGILIHLQWMDFLKHYARLADKSGRSWHPDMLKHLHSALLKSGHYFTSNNISTPIVLERISWSLVELEIPMIWDQITIVDAFKKLLPSESVAIQRFILTHASRISSWSPDAWQPILNLMHSKKLSPLLHEEVALAIASQNPTSWPQEFVTNFQVYTRSLPKDLVKRLPIALAQPQVCKDIFR